MNEDKNKEKLKKAVKSRINGLGLAALFHQVDKTKKDTADEAHKRLPDSPEEKQLIEKLKSNLWQAELERKLPFLKNLSNRIASSKIRARVALALGPNSIKLLEVKSHRGKGVLANAVYIPLPHIVTATTEKMETFITKSLAQALDMGSLKRSSIRTFIPRSKIMVRTLILPTRELSEIKKMLEFEAEHHLPFPLQEMEIDHHVLKQEDNKTHFLLVAAKKDEIAQHLHLLKKAGLKPDTIGVSSLALYNSMLSSMPRQGTTMQISIGSVFTDINIIKDQALMITRGIHWGSKDLTMRLCDSLNVDFDNAEKIKKENGISLLRSFENDTARTISEQAVRWANDLVDEINRTIQHFRLKEGPAEIDRIILSGGGSKLTNLDEYLKSALKTKTTVQKPAKDIEVSSGADVYDKHFHELNVLRGLTSDSGGYGGILVNLLPQGMKRAIRLRRQITGKLLATGILVLIVSFILAMPGWISRTRENRIRRLDRTISELGPKTDVVRELKKKIRTIEDYISTERSCMEILREISIIATPDITIDSFSFERDESVVLSGSARSYSSAVNFSSDLGESKSFQNARLKYAKQRDHLKEDVDFEIICSFKIE